MLGVRDVEGEWVKFVAHHRGKGTVATDFHALWPKWAVMARDYERRDRERDAQRSGRRGQETRPAPYHANGSRRRVDVDIGAQLEARLEAEKPSKPAGDP